MITTHRIASEFPKPSRLRRVLVAVGTVVGLFASQCALALDVAAPLAFVDFYKRPVGPRGLEPAPRLLALQGQRVELSGYLVQRADAAGPLIVAPVPVVLGDEDESLADDLPPAVVYLHTLDARIADALQACKGSLRVRGRLELGRTAESDGRFSFVRLQTDDAQCSVAKPR